METARPADRGRSTTSGTVRCVLELFRAPDGRSRWYKLVRNVATALPEGYTLDGDLIHAGEEMDLPIGSVLVAKEPAGPKRRPLARWYSRLRSVVRTSTSVPSLSARRWLTPMSTPTGGPPGGSGSCSTT